MARTWAGRLGPTPPPPTPDDNRPPLWRLFLRRPADTRERRTALYHRLHEIAEELGAHAVTALDKEEVLEQRRRKDAGDTTDAELPTPLADALAALADELDRLSHE